MDNFLGPVTWTLEDAGPLAPVSEVIVHTYMNDDDACIIILSEPRDNPGMSITNTIYKWAEKLWEHPTCSPQHTTWIEHKPATKTEPASFDRVTFGMENYRTSWDPMTSDEVVKLIGTFPPQF